MPTYTYECDKGNTIFDEFHLMSEAIENCKECGSSGVKRVISKPFMDKRINNKPNRKTGNIVKNYIEDVKEELKQEKKKLVTKEY